MMMRRPYYRGLAIAAAAICILSVLVLRRYLPYGGGGFAPAPAPAIVLEMRNSSFIGLSHRRKVWTVRAKNVEIGQNRSITTLTDITQGKIFDAGKVALRVQAGRAQYNSLNGDLALDHGVSLIGAGGQKLTAKGADWNSAASTLRSNGGARFASNWGTASTNDILVDLKSKEMTMRNVVMSIDIAKQGAEPNVF